MQYGKRVFLCSAHSFDVSSRGDVIGVTSVLGSAYPIIGSPYATSSERTSEEIFSALVGHDVQPNLVHPARREGDTSIGRTGRLP